MTDHEQILVERDGAVAVITLNRPERMNAWTWRMSYELSAAFNELDADDEVRAIVVTGAGRAFCAGADLEAGGETFSGRGTSDRDRQAAQELRAFKRARSLNTPI